MNHDYVMGRTAAANLQVRAVPHQSDAYRELDAKIREAAGGINGSVRVRMKSDGEEAAEVRRRTNTEFLTLGYEHARKAILSGVAELA